MGRLPVRYRRAIWVAGVVTFALTGAWLGYVVQVTPSWPASMLAGTVLGALAVAAFLRAMGRRPGRSSSAAPHGP